jgi:hypothetical protein
MIAMLLAGALAQEIPRCAQYDGVGFALTRDSSAVRQGDTVTLTPMRVERPGMPLTPFPEDCVTNWKIEGQGAAFTKDHRVRVRTKAVPGTVIRVTARYGDRTLSTSFTVLGAGQATLAGRYRVVSQEQCNGGDLAEMNFTAEGYYTYTRSRDMVETMVSGSGNYRWDPVTGKFELVHDGRVWQAGKAVHRDGQVLLDNIDPGGFMRDPPERFEARVCRITLGGG